VRDTGKPVICLLQEGSAWVILINVIVVDSISIISGNTTECPGGAQDLVCLCQSQVFLSSVTVSLRLVLDAKQWRD
jgi:hypothetical protein